jgi:hypothetical protein
VAISPQEFGASFKEFLDQMKSAAPEAEPFFRQRLMDHFQQDPAKLPTLTEKFDNFEHANVHLAIESALAQPQTRSEMMGASAPHGAFGLTMAALAAPKASSDWDAPTEAPLEYINIRLAGERVVACVQSGLCLMNRADERLAVLIVGPQTDYHPAAQVRLEVMARTREAAENFLAEIRTVMRKRNVYRGHVLSLDQDRFGGMAIAFHQLPGIRREDIILPDGILDRIERQTVRFSLLADRLVAAKRHLKRGVLLYGPPGTGKTLSAMYIAGAIKDRTVLLLTGRGQGLLEQSCGLARMLQPSIVILEDVDLVAEERTHREGCATPLLFELLNQMDGLADDADVLFLLTTNRADILEPALAARPGRVDLAVEIPLPDAGCRERLIKLYCEGLQLGPINLESLVGKTEGASGAFIREMMRKATLFAADEGSDVVQARHLDEAVHELVVQGGAMTRRMLGFAKDKV